VTDDGARLAHIGKGACPDHLVDTRALGRVLDGLGDGESVAAQSLEADAEIRFAVECNVGGVEGFDTR
jgi:hypothetical protein